MDQLHSTTTEHKKGQHLTFEERVLIQTRIKDGWKAGRIAAEIGCAPNTVRNEIKRGTVTLYTGNVHRYKANASQSLAMSTIPGVYDALSETIEKENPKYFPAHND